MVRWIIVLTWMALLPGATPFATNPMNTPRCMQWTASRRFERLPSCLHASNNNNNATSAWDDKLNIDEPILVGVDVLAIFLSCQLMGLLDVLNDPSFWSNGGLLQPIPMIPATLDTLVQRTSAMSVSWIAAGILTGGYERKAVVGSFVATSGRLVAVYTVVRVVLALAAASGEGIDMFDLIRQCYYPLLLNSAFRYIYSKSSR